MTRRNRAAITPQSRRNHAWGAKGWQRQHDLISMRACFFSNEATPTTTARVMTEADSSGMTSPILRALRDHWLALKGKRAMPSRADIEPTDIPALLPHIVLVDVFGAPPAFRYRLIGTAVTKIAGRDATGRILDETLYGANTDRVLRTYRETVADRSPKAVREIVQFVDKDWIKTEVLLMPLSGDGRTIDMIIGAVDIVDQDPNPRHRDRRETLDWIK